MHKVGSMVDAVRLTRVIAGIEAEQNCPRCRAISIYSRQFQNRSTYKENQRLIEETLRYIEDVYYFIFRYKYGWFHRYKETTISLEVPDKSMIYMLIRIIKQN